MAKTNAQRQANRLALLNQAAWAAGWGSWRQYETAIVNREANMSTKSTKQPAETPAERAKRAYELRPCDYRHTDGDQSKRAFARRLADNAGMNPSPALVRELVKLINLE